MLIPGIPYAYDLRKILWLNKYPARREKMVTKSEAERAICPFTLEVCEDCYERKSSGHQGICSFTLEPCLCGLTGCLCGLTGCLGHNNN